MPAPSLFSSALKMCVKNVRSIEDVGDMLYRQIRPLLMRIESPEQLRRIEVASPQIQGDDAEIWQKFIARDIPTWEKKNYQPKNPKSWYKIYKKYRDEQAEEIAKDQEKLREQMMGLQKKREQNVSKIVDLKSLPRLPRDPNMRVQNGGVPFKKKSEVKSMSSLLFTSGSRTKMVDGRSVLNRARREAKEIHAMSKLSKPTQSLAGRSGQVLQAPAGMTKEYQIKAQPDSVRVLSSKRRSLPGNDHQYSSELVADLDAREARLRQAMQPKAESAKRTSEGKTKVPIQTTLDFSDDEEVGNLFDEGSPKINRPLKSMPKPITQKASSATTKPSDIISQMLIKKQQPAAVRKTTDTVDISIARSKPQANSSSPPPRNRSKSPDLPCPKRGPNGMVMPKKRKEVDIFNRRPIKKPRAG